MCIDSALSLSHVPLGGDKTIEAPSIATKLPLTPPPTHTHTQGQNWIERVRHCLMNKISGHTHLWTPPLLPPSCDDVALSAFNSHSDCYLEGGVCTSVVTNCDSFLQVISILDFSDLLVSTRVGFRIAAKQVSPVCGQCESSVATGFRVWPQGSE